MMAIPIATCSLRQLRRIGIELPTLKLWIVIEGIKDHFDQPGYSNLEELLVKGASGEECSDQKKQYTMISMVLNSVCS